VDAPDSDLLCVICSLVCRDAVETSCGHLFCAACLSQWQQQKRECVTCRTPLATDGVRPAAFLRRKILSAAVHCPHGGPLDSAESRCNGGLCKWTGELRNLSSHLRTRCPVARLAYQLRVFASAPGFAGARLSLAEGAHPSEAEIKEDVNPSNAPDGPDRELEEALVRREVDAVLPPTLLRALPLPLLARLVDRLAGAQLLAPSYSSEEALHILWMLSSFEAFDQLFTGRGLPVEDVARFLGDLAVATLTQGRAGPAGGSQ